MKPTVDERAERRSLNTTERRKKMITGYTRAMAVTPGEQVELCLYSDDPTWANLVRKVVCVQLLDEVGDLGWDRGGGVDGLAGDGQFEGSVASEGSDQAFDR